MHHEKPPAITFRALDPLDVPQLFHWLNEPHVKKWWTDDASTLDIVRSDYLPYCEPEAKVAAYIALFDNVPSGYIQRYRTKDHKDYWGNQGFGSDTAGIDLYIGNPGLIGRGMGVQLIRAFLTDVVFVNEEVNRCIIDPAPENLAAIRAYTKVGFRYLRTISPPEHIEVAYLMEITRAEFETSGETTMKEST